MWFTQFLIINVMVATTAMSHSHGDPELALLRELEALEEEMLLRRDAADESAAGSGGLRSSVSTAAVAARISAFNIRVFGDTKYSKPDVVAVLLQILPRYDICLVMEIRDADGSSFPSLVNDINQASAPVHYEYVISERLGATSSKEQYAFIYRPDMFVLEATYQYPESPIYNREPYAAIFTSTTLAIDRFALMAIHTDPDEAVSEIDGLVDAYDALARAHDIQDVIIMGDFNADCSYVSSSDWPNIRLRTQSRFDWLINDDADTTVSNSDCAYDRFVVAGGPMKCAIQADSVAIYRFDGLLGLTQDQALDVSDHYPIELVLKLKTSQAEDESIKVADSFTVEGSIYADSMRDVNDYLDASNPGNLGFSVTSYGSAMARLTTEGVMDVVKLMEDAYKTMPELVTYGISTAVITYFRDAAALADSPFFPCSDSQPADTYQITVDIVPGTTQVTVLRNVH